MKRIFGNRGAPEDCPDQIFAGFALSVRISFRHELLIGGRECCPCCGFGFHAPLRKGHQRPAHRYVAFFRYTPDFSRKLCRNRHALTDGSSSPSGCGFSSGRHDLIVVHLHHCGAPVPYSTRRLYGSQGGAPAGSACKGLGSATGFDKWH